MSISKDLDMRINDGVASLSENFYLYKNDRGIELRLRLNISKLGFRSVRQILTFNDREVSVRSTILKPNQEVIKNY